MRSKRSKQRSSVSKAVWSLKKAAVKKFGVKLSQVKVQGGKVFVPKRAAYQELRLKEQKKAASAAIKAFKPRAADKGKFIIVGTGGKRNAKRGYLAYVTKTGKVWHPTKGIKEPNKSRDKGQVQVSTRGPFRKAGEKFQLKRVAKIKPAKKGQAPESDIKRALRTIKKEGIAKTATGAELAGFIESGRGKGRGHVDTRKTGGLGKEAVKGIAKHIQGVIRHQAGHRQFVIRVMGLVQKKDGSKETFSFITDIARADADAIKLGGIENFVRMKFYAQLAQQLAYLGYVTAGSANHIRHLADNKGVDPEDWTDKNGEAWGGADKEQVRLLSLDWRIDQQ